MMMLKVKDEEAKGEVLEFLKSLKQKQRELAHEKQIYYPTISLYAALKNKLFLKNLLLHPVILEKKNFYDKPKRELTTETLVLKLSQVLEYEFMIEETLTVEERNKIIKVHKKLLESLEKVNAV